MSSEIIVLSLIYTSKFNLYFQLMNKSKRLTSNSQATEMKKKKLLALLIK